MRAASLNLMMHLDRDREQEESERILLQARRAAEHAERVAQSIERMNRLYRDRLVGIRKRKEAP